MGLSVSQEGLCSMELVMDDNVTNRLWKGDLSVHLLKHKNTVKYFSVQCSQTFERTTVCWKITWLCPLVVLSAVVLRWSSVWSVRGMILTGENRGTRRNPSQWHFLHRRSYLVSGLHPKQGFHWPKIYKSRSRLTKTVYIYNSKRQPTHAVWESTRLVRFMGAHNTQ